MPNRDRGKFCVNESNFGTSEQIYTKIPVVSAKCGKEDESGETGAGTKKTGIQQRGDCRAGGHQQGNRGKILERGF